MNCVEGMLRFFITMYCFLPIQILPYLSQSEGADYAHYIGGQISHLNNPVITPLTDVLGGKEAFLRKIQNRTSRKTGEKIVLLYAI